MKSFTIQIAPIPDDDAWRPVAAHRATIAEDPRFVHAVGVSPAEALGLALLYLNRIADLRAGVRLDIRSLPASAPATSPDCPAPDGRRPRRSRTPGRGLSDS